MKKTVWKPHTVGKNVAFTQLEDRLLLEMKPPLWTNAYLLSNQYPCEENKIYKIHVDANGGKADLRLLIQFYGNADVKGYRFYIDPEDEICVPPEMNRFDVSAILCARENSVAVLGQITYEYVRDYAPKNVRLLSISDAMVPEECKHSQADVMRAYCRLIDELAEKEKPDLIVLTEHFHNLCDPGLPLEEKFVDYDHEVVTRIADKAKQHGIYICGSFHIQEDGCRYNRAILFDRQGQIIAEYNKTHLTICEYQMGIRPGEGIVTVDTDIGRIGFLICWDTFFPELLRLYHLAGCDILVNPSRGNAQSQNYAASYTSGAYLVASEFAEMNRIQDRIGDVLDQADDKGYAVATVNIREPGWRYQLSVGPFYGHGRDVFLRERRPDIYGPLAE